MGDKYMAVSGLPEKCSSHARCIARLALDMMDLVQQVKVPDIDVVRVYIALSILEIGFLFVMT